MQGSNRQKPDSTSTSYAESPTNSPTNFWHWEATTGAIIQRLAEIVE